MDMITSYEQACRILGVSVNSTKEEQKNAYRKIAKKYHPDSMSGEKGKNTLSPAEREKRIAFYCMASRAYEYLSNAEPSEAMTDNRGEQSGHRILGNAKPYATRSSSSQTPYRRKQMEEKRKAEKLEQLRQKAQEIHAQEQKEKETQLLNQIRWLRIADIIHRVMREDQQKKEE